MISTRLNPNLDRKLPLVHEIILWGSFVVIVSLGSVAQADINAVADFFKTEQPEYVILAAARVGGIHANMNHQAEFIYENLTTSFEKYGKENRKLTFYAPDKLCVGGIVSEWKEPDKEKQGGEDWNFWDDKNKRFLLGDFNKFASYLESFIGFNIKHSSSIDENNTYFR